MWWFEPDDGNLKALTSGGEATGHSVSVDGLGVDAFLPKNSPSLGEVTIFFLRSDRTLAPPTLCLASPSRPPLDFRSMVHNGVFGFFLM
jgi:hypothetical protein